MYDRLMSHIAGLLWLLEQCKGTSDQIVKWTDRVKKLEEIGSDIEARVPVIKEIFSGLAGAGSIADLYVVPYTGNVFTESRANKLLHAFNQIIHEECMKSLSAIGE